MLVWIAAGALTWFGASICAELTSAFPRTGGVCGRKYISDEERESLSQRYVVIGKKLTRWIQHLEKEDRPSQPTNL